MTVRPYFDENGVTLYHGDAFDILHDLEGVGAVVTDPPYSSGGAFRGDRAQQTSLKYVNSDSRSREYLPEFAGDNRDQRSFVVWSTMWLNACRQASVVGAPLVSFIDWRNLPALTDAVQAGGWVWRNVGTWWKPGVRMQKGRLSASAEYVVYATNGPAAEGQGSPQNVFRCPPDPSAERDHIAQKPVDVGRWALQVAPPGAVVLDPFMGSGAVLVAARSLGHPVIGIDVDERYCDVAAKRLAQGVLDFVAG